MLTKKIKLVKTALLVCLINSLHTVSAEKTLTITKQQSLSQWYLEQLKQNQLLPHEINQSFWISHAEKNKQQIEKLQFIQQMNQIALTTEELAFAKWIKKLQPTGKVNLPFTEYRFLEINKNFDPILQVNDKIVIRSNSNKILVISNENEKCSVIFDDAANTLDYIDSCGITADKAYIIEANGKITEQQTALWNASKNQTVKAGSIIYVPKNGLVSSQTPALNNRILNILSYSIHKINFASLKPRAVTPTQRLFKGTDNQLSTNNWGEVGLINSPTARMNKSGNIQFSYINKKPLSIYGIGLQPFDNLAVNLDFIKKEKEDAKESIDVKLQLLNETSILPALAIGFRGLNNHSQYSSEYIATNKRFGLLDLSVGFGYGNLSGKEYTQQNKNTILDNKRNKMFSGDSQVFAGLELDIPKTNFAMKIEYLSDKDVNDIENLLSYGIVWQNSNVELHANYENGDSFTGGVTLKENYKSAPSIKLNNVNDEYKLLSNKKLTDKTKLANDIKKYTNLKLLSVDVKDDAMYVALDNTTGIYVKDKIEDALLIINKYTTANVNTFYFELYESNQKLQTIEVDRQRWLNAQTRLLPSSQNIDYIYVNKKQANTNTISTDAKKGFDYWAKPTINIQTNSDDKMVYDLGGEMGVYLPLWRNSWVDASVGVNLYDNYKNSGNNKNKTNIIFDRYEEKPRFNINNLQINQLIKLGKDKHLLGYAGVFDENFIGVGSEFLYRKNQANWALGFDVNYLQQRSKTDIFNVKNYNSVTAYLNYYLDTNWNGIGLDAKLGRFAAQDLGALIDLHKTFNSGTKMGVKFRKSDLTKNNTLFQGVYLTIPVEALVRNKSSSSINLNLGELYNDDATIDFKRNHTLWKITHSYSPRLLTYRPNEPEK